MKALVVDDDAVLADLVAFTLQREGFEVVQAFDGEAALWRWADEQPDLLLLDVSLPKLDGFSVCRRIREQANTPIILLTVRGEDDDVVRGLESGADDYIAKPFSPRQLVARARAVLRRAGQTFTPAIYEVGSLTLHPVYRELRYGEREPVSLTPLENRLLTYLMFNAGQILPTATLIDHVWGAEGGDGDMLRQLVRRLRRKIAQAVGASEAASRPSTYIDTMPGRGYGLIVSPSNH
jgi:DNA-binding response OmpR family regulator